MQNQQRGNADKRRDEQLIGVGELERATSGSAHNKTSGTILEN